MCSLFVMIVCVCLLFGGCFKFVEDSVNLL